MWQCVVGVCVCVCSVGMWSVCVVVAVEEQGEPRWGRWAQVRRMVIVWWAGMGGLWWRMNREGGREQKDNTGKTRLEEEEGGIEKAGRKNRMRW